jgi:hypothetical protein
VSFVVERRLAPLVVGSDPRDVAGVWSRMRDATFWDGNGGLVTFGIRAIDMAAEAGPLADAARARHGPDRARERLGVRARRPGPRRHRGRGVVRRYRFREDALGR